ncbi:MAG: hypothetical protein QOG20_6498 [Pseudonocardiales bacterium]|nr:hypothetical protein [Pseudonocardiales bacterium]
MQPDGKRHGLGLSQADGGNGLAGSGRHDRSDTLQRITGARRRAESEHGVDTGIGQQQLQRATEDGCGQVAVVSTGSATAAVPGSSAVSAARVPVSGTAICRPARTHASAARTPAPPALLSTATRGQAGSGWRHSSASSPGSSVISSTASTPAWANNASRTARGVAPPALCEAAANRPASELPERTVRTGIRRARRRARAANQRGAAQRLDVDHRGPGAAVLSPPEKHVVRIDVHGVARRHHRRGPQTEPVQLRGDRDDHPAGLRRHSDLPAGHRVPEGGLHRDVRVGVDQTQTVRPDHAHAVAAEGRGQSPGERRASADARRDHQQSPYTPATALLGDIRHRVRRYTDDGEVDGARQLRHRRHAGDSLDLVSVRVDRVHRSDKPAVEDAAQNQPPTESGRRPTPTTAREHGWKTGRRLAAPASA